MALTNETKLAILSAFDLTDVTGRDAAYTIVAQDKGKSMRDVSDSEVLDYHKEILKSIFSDSCATAIEDGFDSSVNGHHYRTNKDDQINFIGEYLLIQSDATIDTVYWTTEDAGPLPLTRDEFFSIYKEALGHKNSMIQHYWQKKQEVDSYTTHEGLRGCTWDSPFPKPKDTIPPGDITLLTDSTEQTTADFTWTNPTDEDFKQVNIYRNGILVAGVAGASFTDTGLSASTNYTYVLKAADTTGNESAGITTYVQTASGTVLYPEISNLEYSNTDTTVTFNWTNPTSETFSRVEIYRDGTLVGSSTNGTFADANLTGSTAYVYKLTTMDTANNESSGVNISITTDVTVVTQSSIFNIFSTNNNKKEKKKKNKRRFEFMKRKNNEDKID